MPPSARKPPELLSQCVAGDVVQLVDDGRVIRVSWPADLVCFFRPQLADGSWGEVDYLPSNQRVRVVSASTAERDAAGDRPGADVSDPLTRAARDSGGLFNSKEQT